MVTHLMTPKEFASFQRVHVQTVREWIRKGAVPVRRTPGGRVRIVVTDPLADEHMCVNVREGERYEP